MKSGHLAPLLFTAFAALAYLYPMTVATHTPGQNTAPATDIPTSKSGSSEGATASQEFPTAKDLVARFLFSSEGDHTASSRHPSEAPYGIEFLIATVPDPVSSRLPHFFDSFVESLASAAEASGYTPDRYALPWLEKGNRSGDDVPLWHQTLYETVPGMILFRDPKERKLLLIFLVGETPTTGIHKQAMFSALEQMAQFYPWDPEYGNLPSEFPKVSESTDTLRVMGPAFSGSAASLSFVLEKWRESHSNISDVQFQIISGSATAIDSSWISEAARYHETFQAAVPPDSETLQAIACYIDGLGYSKIAILTEGNTAYGQNFTLQTAPRKGTDGRNHLGCENGQSPPEILSLPFPMHISRVRAAVYKATPQQGQAESGAVSGNPASTPPAQASSAEPREVLPSFSDLSVHSAELTLANLLSTISREQYRYVGIVATDVRDVIFLARQVRQHCPATVLFTLNSDLLYANPTVNTATRGMIVITPYPLFNLEQLWTYDYGGGNSRLQFSSQAAEGAYNATLALLHQDGKMVDYGKPLTRATSASYTERHKPSLWVTAIGNEETLPVGLLRWNYDSEYTYLPAATGNAQRQGWKFRIGRGIYAENSVVTVIVLSIFISAFSFLVVSQYWRPEKRGASWVSAILGDTASSAYWFDGRLFLLCCCISLLAFYVVFMVDFALPLMAARKLGGSIEANMTPKIACGIGILTILLLLLATCALTSALRKAPSDQRVSAPEVVIFALLSCAFLFILAGHLAVRWVEEVLDYPAGGFFNHLRSFDLHGGLSPLLPLACVAMGGCLWAFCSYRRLRLVDGLRATETAEKPHSWLNFLSLEGRSFSGVRELENSIKRILESSSVISLGRYSLLLVVGLLVGHYFFATRLVRALEPPPFYWLFEAAFIIIYWALLMEFFRLVYAWRSLHLLLQRLSWHPMHAAFKRYRNCRHNVAKMNLTRPPSLFAALESSVDQASRLVRNAKTLTQAPGTDEGLWNLLRQSIPEWEVQVQAATSDLSEALRLQWTDDSRTEAISPTDTARKKRASRIQGNWRQSLKARCNAHHALFSLLQSLGKSMEGYWSPNPMEDAPPAPTPGVKEFFDQVEEFFVSRLVNFLAIVFPSLQNLGFFVLAGLLLMLLAVTSYPFQPRNEFLFFNWIVVLIFIGTVFWIFVQMDRDTVLSLLNGTNPGEIHFSRELVLRILLYVAVPLLALLGAQFPESLQQLLSLFATTPAPGP
ncbi:MAG TPA: hypothetical protein VEN79_17970 [Terriglobia bacterium]|nr:hypothetical protein [Terriglobia bacterium]